MNTNATYAGPGGSFEGLGVYFADAGQHLEHRLFVDHAAPHCRSNVEYKGALQGDTAHTVWVGDVLIRASAEGTDTYELNRNLLLTDGARADSVPNLEIETGEIEGAGHASATGRFDDEQLFYLMARGIPEDEARRLVVHGFFASVVGRIGVAEVEERLMEAIERELSARCRMSEQLTDTDFVRVRRRSTSCPPWAPLARRDQRAPVSLVRTEDGEVHCIDDACTHANVSLSEGELDGCMLECWLHGSRFDLRTGQPSGPPATVPVTVHHRPYRGRRRPRRPDP
jgi:nitrite reductase/ring-hydroxylating ferredoxin subunit